MLVSRYKSIPAMTNDEALGEVSTSKRIPYDLPRPVVVPSTDTVDKLVSELMLVVGGFVTRDVSACEGSFKPVSAKEDDDVSDG